MWGPHRVWRLEKPRQRALREEIVELFVGQIVGPQGLLPPALRRFQPRGKVVNRVHRARVIDVVAGHQRSVQRARPRRVQKLKKESRLICAPRKDAIDPKILSADSAAQILPLWRLRVRWRFLGVRPDMTKSTGNSDAVRSDEFFRQIVIWVIVKALGIPLARGGLVEVGVWQEPHADNSGGVSVI